jgi:hypothetical protein
MLAASRFDRFEQVRCLFFAIVNTKMKSRRQIPVAAALHGGSHARNGRARTRDREGYGACGALSCAPRFGCSSRCV